MTAWSRLTSALLVMVFLAGPLGSLAAAQQPAQPPAPDLFQEQLKAQRAAAKEPSSAYDAGAVVTNIFLVPGRAITCGLGGLVGVGVLAITLGTGYKAASAVWHEGCGGKWTVSADDIRPDGVSGRPLDYTEMR
jgi:hypothetical protein